ncbi:ankyrin [Polyplosphaeria fusca]|uniref:Ankyrin n=1 Tax=Polyplosphaeria fusca TaxID=682080 RepID=A0A9P4UXF7_9PLEO|nr:ankyrin [Polyplosphaeria fusca]
MARLQPFLQAMEHYAKVVEVLCNGTPYLSWIWAPVKLMLMLSVDFLGAFEKLIDAYGRIADMLPRFDRLAVALSHDHNFQVLLALVYADVLEFHRRAYKFVRRNAWANFFTSIWSGFESRFGAILSNLAYHRELVDKEAIAVDIADAVTRSRLDEERWEKQEREWRAQKIRTVLSWLSTDDTPPENVLEKHVNECIPGSCDWFLDHNKTKSWLRDGASHAFLWLYGKPGAGKSIICSSVVQHAANTGANVLYYFCSYLGYTTKDSSRLLRSLAAQIVQKHHDLGIHVFDNYCQSYSVPTQKALLGMLPELLQGLGSVRIVVDGIDEWTVAAQKEALRHLTQLVSTDSSSCICKILVVSRDTLEISRILRKKGSRAARATSVSLSDEEEIIGINNSIASLIDNKLSNLPDHFSDLDPGSTISGKIKQALLTKSNGMFLWVRLVLDSLDSVYSPEELGNIVDDLPTDLDALYHQILERLCSTPGAGKYGGVLAILGWICFARRPLHKVEILHGLAMHPVEGSSAPLSVPIPQILDHCKPFIEERPDSTIVFVHFSISEFLLKSNFGERISRELSQLNISYACTSALVKGLSLLGPRKTSEYLISIANGTHRLLPYSINHWIEHCLDYAKCGGKLDMNCPLPRLLAELQRKHDQLLQEIAERDPSHHQSASDVDMKSFKDGFELLRHLPAHQLMQDVLSDQSNTSQYAYAEAFASQHDRTLFSNLAARFEHNVLYLLTQDDVDGIPQETLEKFKRSYSSTAFRCRFPSCFQASTGFASQEQRATHEITHFYRIKCSVETCQWSRIGFKSKTSLDAHTRKYHDPGSTYLIPPSVRRPTEGSDSAAPAIVSPEISFSPSAISKKNTDKFGSTRLARECEKGQLSLVKEAYNAAPEELNTADFANIAPLQKAALHGWSDVVGFLLAKGCRTDCQSNDGDTPLIDAVENGHLEVVRLLLNWGRVNPHHQNRKGQRAIDVLDSDDEEYEEIERVLKDTMRRENTTTTSKENDPSRLLYNEYNQETLVEKASSGDIAAVGELLNKPNMASGVAAARGGHFDVLSMLLASGLKADPNPLKHETPMLVAIGQGHLDIIRLLLDQVNFDPTRRNCDGRAYWEISEDRRGPKWEQEREMLKAAYDNFQISVSMSQAPPKARRLMSGKEMRNRNIKNRRRVVDGQSTGDDSEDEVRAPAKKGGPLFPK